MIDYKINHDYAHVVARVHALETKLISKQEVSKLIDAPDEKLIIDFLKQINYGNLKDLENINIEKFITSELQNVFELLYPLIPDYDKHLLSLFKYKYDFQNYKIVASRTLFNRQVNGLSELGNINPSIFLELFPGKTTFLPEPFNILSSKLLTEKPDNIYQLETTIEKFKWEFILTQIDKEVFLTNLFRTIIDLENIVLLYQMKLFNIEKKENFIDGGTISVLKLSELVTQPQESIIQYFKLTPYSFFQFQNHQELEKSIDNFLIDYLSENFKYSFFSIGPVVNFLYQKEYEAQMLKTLWTAKLNKLDKNYIRENLRKLYV